MPLHTVAGGRGRFRSPAQKHAMRTNPDRQERSEKTKSGIDSFLISDTEIGTLKASKSPSRRDYKVKRSRDHEVSWSRGHDITRLQDVKALKDMAGATTQQSEMCTPSTGSVGIWLVGGLVGW